MLLLNYMYTYDLIYTIMHFHHRNEKKYFSSEIWVTTVLTISNILFTLTHIHVYQLGSFHTMKLKKIKLRSSLLKHGSNDKFN